jgi:hypothetical protein
VENVIFDREPHGSAMDSSEPPGDVEQGPTVAALEAALSATGVLRPERVLQLLRAQVTARVGRRVIKCRSQSKHAE